MPPSKRTRAETGFFILLLFSLMMHVVMGAAAAAQADAAEELPQATDDNDEVAGASASDEDAKSESGSESEDEEVEGDDPQRAEDVRRWDLAGCPLLPVFDTPRDEDGNIYVPEVPAKEMTMQVFYRDFVRHGRPVIIKGGTRKWGSTRKWTDEFLRRNLGDTWVEPTLSDTNVMHFYGKKVKLTRMRFRDFLDEYRSPNRTRNLYLAQHPTRELMHLEGDVPMPKIAAFLTPHASNVWIGAGDEVTPLHFDNHENLLCMMDGKKQLLLFEPADTNYIYPVERDRESALLSEITDFNNVDLRRFPLYRHATPTRIEVAKGDILYLPSNWWHEVRSVGRSVAANFWFDPNSETQQRFMEYMADRVHYASVARGLIEKKSPFAHGGHTEEFANQLERQELVREKIGEQQGGQAGQTSQDTAHHKEEL